jgi:CheY-like chemotaxis protein
MTGRSEADHQGVAFDAWLTKPVSVDRLTKTLQSILEV